jgi:hypothetical protein
LRGYRRGVTATDGTALWAAPGQLSRSGRFAGGTSAPGMSMSSPSCWAV